MGVDSGLPGLVALEQKEGLDEGGTQQLAAIVREKRRKGQEVALARGPLPALLPGYEAKRG